MSAARKPWKRRRLSRLGKCFAFATFSHSYGCCLANMINIAVPKTTQRYKVS